jgi:membrane protease YdiL (CAAX protease family)
MNRLGQHLQGHVFLFARQPLPGYAPAVGIRLLLIFFFLEAVIGPRLWLFNFLGLPNPPAWLRVPVLLGLALLLIRFFAGVKFAQIGLVAWRHWNVTEKSYFLQTLLIANVIFGIIFADRLRMIFGDPGWWGREALVVFVNALWGFHQELVYRGILQTELVRRWGSLPGILASNLIFTFGPLHFYHFSAGTPGAAWPVFAGVFLIGLFFGILYRTSGNLMIVGALHGLGNCYIDGLGRLTH